jgi:hypothetical protein
VHHGSAVLLAGLPAALSLSFTNHSFHWSATKHTKAQGDEKEYAEGSAA